MKSVDRVWLPSVLVLTCFVALLLAAPTPSRACMGDCNTCWAAGCRVCQVSGSSIRCTDCGHVDQLTAVRTPPTIVRFVTPRRALITVQGYKSTRLQTTTSCVVALSPVDGVERVNSVTNLESDRGRNLPVTFASALTPGLSLADLAIEKGFGSGDRAWNGFLSNITGEVADNTPLHFVIDVTLSRGTSQEEFLANLRTQGVFVTSSSSPLGVPDEGHQYYRKLGATDLVVVYPENRPDGRPHRD